jgi:hypothetical protein
VLLVVAVLLATRGGDTPQPPSANAKAHAAFAAAETYLAQHPDDLHGAVAQFDAVRSAHAGTPWAARAGAKLQELERKKADVASKAQAAAQLRRALADLRSRAAALVEKDRFGDAIELADAFATEHASREAADLKDQILAKARSRYDDLAAAADAAVERKEFAKARAALAPAKSFGIPDLTTRAKEKLAHIASRETSAAQWEDIRTRAAKLAEAGKHDDALKLLEGAKTLPLDGIANLIAGQRKAIEGARRAAGQAIAAYRKESDKVWALFKERKYPEADKLLAELAARADHALAAEHLRADAEAAKSLKAFWAVVARGVLTRRGRFLAIAGVGGNVVSVTDGEVTL